MIPEQVRAFLEEPRLCVLATINRDGAPQLTAMWYELRDDVVVMNTARDRLKERNMRRDPRVSICVVDGEQYVTLSGWVELIEDAAIQAEDVTRLATRYHGPRRGGQRWTQIREQGRISVHLHVERVHARGFPTAR